MHLGTFCKHLGTFCKHLKVRYHHLLTGCTHLVRGCHDRAWGWEIGGSEVFLTAKVEGVTGPSRGGTAPWSDVPKHQFGRQKPGKSPIRREFRRTPRLWRHRDAGVFSCHGRSGFHSSSPSAFLTSCFSLPTPILLSQVLWAFNAKTAG